MSKLDTTDLTCVSFQHATRSVSLSRPVSDRAELKSFIRQLDCDKDVHARQQKQTDAKRGPLLPTLRMVQFLGSISCGNSNANTTCVCVSNIWDKSK